MAESDTIFKNKIKFEGIFNFGDFYQFCYDWLNDETEVDFVAEEKYSEKIKGNGKNIDIEWTAPKKVTDFFMFKYKIKFKIINLEKVEINQGGVKTSTNKGNVEVALTGILVRDYRGKFEKSAFQKFLRTSYERWIIAGRIDQMETKLFLKCDEFLAQAKAFLDLEGKR